jgi:hypothetical protein
MGLLSRFSKLALAVFVLLTLTSIPGTWSPPQTGYWLSAPPAWAGSPDETLRPRNPAGRFTPDNQQGSTSAAAIGTRVQAPGLTRFQKLALVWKVSLASVLRLRF